MADKPEAIAQAEKCAAQGNVVRDLKAQKADKAQIDEAVKLLLSLKAEYKGIFGNDEFYLFDNFKRFRGLIWLHHQRRKK